MNLLTLKLKYLAKKFPLEQFEWEIPEDCPIDFPLNLSTNYEKNLFLKFELPKLIKKRKDLKPYYWIIQKWGGIGSFKENEFNNQRIIKFIAELSSGRLTKNNFNVISSLSKVASFIDPNNFVIYDSRVIYSLNWLLFNYTAEPILFLQPSGRSTELAKFDMKTIFNLSKKHIEYRSHKNSYHEYCEMMKSLSKEVYGMTAKPFMLEMLLFMIAPTWTVQDIESRVIITINSDLLE